jgi:hypothetical protein
MSMMKRKGMGMKSAKKASTKAPVDDASITADLRPKRPGIGPNAG